MILVDPRKGSKELLPLIKQISGKAELAEPALPFGDFAFQGCGPTGPIQIGIERKALHDMLACIDDHRYTGHQKIGMKEMYDVSILVIEGMWQPHKNQGFLMEGFRNRDGKVSYGYCMPGGRPIMYSKLARYLMSVALSGVLITYTDDQWGTAFEVCEWFQYFQKKWENHTSLLEMHKLAIPDLRGKPTLVRRWAADLEDVGTKISIEAERMFKTPLELATADETQWMRIKGIGAKMAMKIVQSIRGRKR